MWRVYCVWYSQVVQVVEVAQRVRGQAPQPAAVQPQPLQRAAQRAAAHRLQPVHRQVPTHHTTAQLDMHTHTRTKQICFTLKLLSGFSGGAILPRQARTTDARA